MHEHRLWRGRVPDACRGSYPASEQWRCYFGYRLYGTLDSTYQPHHHAASPLTHPRALADLERVKQLTGPRFRGIVLDRSAVGQFSAKGPGHFSWIIFNADP